MRPAHIRMPPALAASPVLPSSMRSPTAESLVASLPVRACSFRACRPPESASAKETRYVSAFEIGSVEVHLEFVARLVVEARLNVDAGNVRVHVHDEYCAVVTREDVQVVDIKLAVLRCERGIEVMRHGGKLHALILQAVL